MSTQLQALSQATPTTQATPPTSVLIAAQAVRPSPRPAVATAAPPKLITADTALTNPSTAAAPSKKLAKSLSWRDDDPSMCAATHSVRSRAAAFGKPIASPQPSHEACAAQDWSA